MIWIIGEYAERIDNADELLATFLEGFQDENSQVNSNRSHYSMLIIFIVIKSILRTLSFSCYIIIAAVSLLTKCNMCTRIEMAFLLYVGPIAIVDSHCQTVFEKTN